MRALIAFAAAAAVVATAQPAGVRSAMKPAAERMMAPAFRLMDHANKPRELRKYHGHVVLLNFWATSCGGCKEEIPYFMRFDDTYRSGRLQTIGVSIDIAYEQLKGPQEAWALVNPFVEETRIRYPILMGDDAVNKAYSIDSLPATYLIDKKGRVAAVYQGVVDRADVEANIKMLLKER